MFKYENIDFEMTVNVSTSVNVLRVQMSGQMCRFVSHLHVGGDKIKRHVEWWPHEPTDDPVGSKLGEDGELQNMTAVLWDIKGKWETGEDDYSPFLKSFVRWQGKKAENWNLNYQWDFFKWVRFADIYSLVEQGQYRGKC